MKNELLYDPKTVRSLFDEMAGTYGWMNLISSFGFTYRWRRQCLAELTVGPNANVVDLMAGMGELCCELNKSSSFHGTLIAVDNSTAMCQLASRNAATRSFTVIEADALACPFASSTIDHVFCTFGLKTFSDEQLSQLAREVGRTLRPGGTFAFLEISVPPSRLLRWPLLIYINRIVPILGRLFLGNPDNYRMLGVYTMAFQNCRLAKTIFVNAGLDVELRSYFFGCATGLVGRKP